MKRAWRAASIRYAFWEVELQAFRYFQTGCCRVSTSEHCFGRRRGTRNYRKEKDLPHVAPRHPSSTEFKTLGCVREGDQFLGFDSLHRLCRRISSRSIIFRATEPCCRVHTWEVDYRSLCKGYYTGFRDIVSHRFISVITTSQVSLTKPKKSVILALDNQSQKNRTTRRVTFPSMSQVDLQTQYPIARLCCVQNTPGLARKHLNLMANGILDIFSHTTSSDLMSSFFLGEVHLSENTASKHATEARERILTANALNPHPLQSKEG